MAHTLELFQCWAAQKGLLASAADYVARAPKRQLLRFSQSRRRYERLGLLVEREALAETRARAR